MSKGSGFGYLLGKFFGTLGIGFFSLVYAGVSFHTFQMSSYSLFRIRWNISGLFDTFLLVSSWIFTLVLTVFLVREILKSITTDYKYHFKYWLIVVILFSIPIITNWGWNWYIFATYLGIPIAGINYLANGFHSADLERHKKLSFFILLFISLVGGYAEYKATSSAEFENERFEFEVNTYTIPTFLDWSIQAEIEIDDKKSGESYEFDFNYGDGPYFSIGQDPFSDSILYIKGDRSNSNLDWIINLKENTIRESDYTKEIENFELIVTHDSSFELIYPKD